LYLFKKKELKIKFLDFLPYHLKKEEEKKEIYK